MLVFACIALKKVEVRTHTYCMCFCQKIFIAFSAARPTVMLMTTSLQTYIYRTFPRQKGVPAHIRKRCDPLEHI